MTGLEDPSLAGELIAEKALAKRREDDAGMEDDGVGIVLGEESARLYEKGGGVGKRTGKRGEDEWKEDLSGL